MAAIDFKGLRAVKILITPKGMAAIGHTLNGL
jgi:hypothetical protein